MVFDFFVDWVVFVAWRGITLPLKNFCEEQYFFCTDCDWAQGCHFLARSEMVTGNYIFFRCIGRLPGWIRLLLVSITTMKIINTSEAPCGKGVQIYTLYFVLTQKLYLLPLKLLLSILSGSFRYRFMRIIQGNYFVQFSRIKR